MSSSLCHGHTAIVLPLDSSVIHLQMVIFIQYIRPSFISTRFLHRFTGAYPGSPPTHPFVSITTRFIHQFISRLSYSSSSPSDRSYPAYSYINWPPYHLSIFMITIGSSIHLHLTTSFHHLHPWFFSRFILDRFTTTIMLPPYHQYASRFIIQSPSATCPSPYSKSLMLLVLALHFDVQSYLALCPICPELLRGSLWTLALTTSPASICCHVSQSI